MYQAAVRGRPVGMVDPGMWNNPGNPGGVNPTVAYSLARTMGRGRSPSTVVKPKITAKFVKPTTAPPPADQAAPTPKHMEQAVTPVGLELPPTPVRSKTPMPMGVPKSEPKRSLAPTPSSGMSQETVTSGRSMSRFRGRMVRKKSESSLESTEIHREEPPAKKADIRKAPPIEAEPKKKGKKLEEDAVYERAGRKYAMQLEPTAMAVATASSSSQYEDIAPDFQEMMAEPKSKPKKSLPKKGPPSKQNLMPEELEPEYKLRTKRHALTTPSILKYEEDASEVMEELVDIKQKSKSRGGKASSKIPDPSELDESAPRSKKRDVARAAVEYDEEALPSEKRKGKKHARRELSEEPSTEETPIVEEVEAKAKGKRVKVASPPLKHQVFDEESVEITEVEKPKGKKRGTILSPSEVEREEPTSKAKAKKGQKIKFITSEQDQLPHSDETMYDGEDDVTVIKGKKGEKRKAQREYLYTEGQRVADEALGKSKIKPKKIAPPPQSDVELLDQIRGDGRKKKDGHVEEREQKSRKKLEADVIEEPKLSSSESPTTVSTSSVTEDQAPKAKAHRLIPTTERDRKKRDREMSAATLKVSKRPREEGSRKPPADLNSTSQEPDITEHKRKGQQRELKLQTKEVIPEKVRKHEGRSEKTEGKVSKAEKEKRGRDKKLDMELVMSNLKIASEGKSEKEVGKRSHKHKRKAKEADLEMEKTPEQVSQQVSQEADRKKKRKVRSKSPSMKMRLSPDKYVDSIKIVLLPAKIIGVDVRATESSSSVTSDDDATSTGSSSVMKEDQMVQPGVEPSAPPASFGELRSSGEQFAPSPTENMQYPPAEVLHRQPAWTTEAMERAAYFPQPFFTPMMADVTESHGIAAAGQGFLLSHPQQGFVMSNQYVDNNFYLELLQSLSSMGPSHQVVVSETERSIDRMKEGEGESRSFVSGDTDFESVSPLIKAEEQFITSEEERGPSLFATPTDRRSFSTITIQDIAPYMIVSSDQIGTDESLQEADEQLKQTISQVLERQLNAKSPASNLSLLLSAISGGKVLEQSYAGTLSTDSDFSSREYHLSSSQGETLPKVFVPPVADDQSRQPFTTDDTDKRYDKLSEDDTLSELQPTAVQAFKQVEGSWYSMGSNVSASPTATSLPVKVKRPDTLMLKNTTSLMEPDIYIGSDVEGNIKMLMHKVEFPEDTQSEDSEKKDSLRVQAVESKVSDQKTVTWQVTVLPAEKKESASGSVQGETAVSLQASFQNFMSEVVEMLATEQRASQSIIISDQAKLAPLEVDQKTMHQEEQWPLVPRSSEIQLAQQTPQQITEKTAENLSGSTISTTVVTQFIEDLAEIPLEDDGRLDDQLARETIAVTLTEETKQVTDDTKVAINLDESKLEPAIIKSTESKHSSAATLKTESKVKLEDELRELENGALEVVSSKPSVKSVPKTVSSGIDGLLHEKERLYVASSEELRKVSSKSLTPVGKRSDFQQYPEGREKADISRASDSTSDATILSKLQAALSHSGQIEFDRDVPSKLSVKSIGKISEGKVSAKSLISRQSERSTELQMVKEAESVSSFKQKSEVKASVEEVKRVAAEQMGMPMQLEHDFTKPMEAYQKGSGLSQFDTEVTSSISGESRKSLTTELKRGKSSSSVAESLKRELDLIKESIIKSTDSTSEVTELRKVDIADSEEGKDGDYLDLWLREQGSIEDKQDTEEIQQGNVGPVLESQHDETIKPSESYVIVLEHLSEWSGAEGSNEIAGVEHSVATAIGDDNVARGSSDKSMTDERFIEYEDFSEQPAFANRPEVLYPKLNLEYSDTPTANSGLMAENEFLPEGEVVTTEDSIEWDFKLYDDGENVEKLTPGLSFMSEPSQTRTRLTTVEGEPYYIIPVITPGHSPEDGLSYLKEVKVMPYYEMEAEESLQDIVTRSHISEALVTIKEEKSTDSEILAMKSSVNQYSVLMVSTSSEHDAETDKDLRDTLTENESSNYDNSQKNIAPELCIKSSPSSKSYTSKQSSKTVKSAASLKSPESTYSLKEHQQLSVPDAWQSLNDPANVTALPQTLLELGIKSTLEKSPQSTEHRVGFITSGSMDTLTSKLSVELDAQSAKVSTASVSDRSRASNLPEIQSEESQTNLMKESSYKSPASILSEHITEEKVDSAISELAYSDFVGDKLEPTAEPRGEVIDQSELSGFVKIKPYPSTQSTKSYVLKESFQPTIEGGEHMKDITGTNTVPTTFPNIKPYPSFRSNSEALSDANIVSSEPQESGSILGFSSASSLKSENTDDKKTGDQSADFGTQKLMVAQDIESVIRSTASEKSSISVDQQLGSFAYYTTTQNIGNVERDKKSAGRSLTKTEYAKSLQEIDSNIKSFLSSKSGHQFEIHSQRATSATETTSNDSLKKLLKDSSQDHMLTPKVQSGLSTESSISKRTDARLSSLKQESSNSEKSTKVDVHSRSAEQGDTENISKGYKITYSAATKSTPKISNLLSTGSIEPIEDILREPSRSSLHGKLEPKDTKELDPWKKAEEIIASNRWLKRSKESTLSSNSEKSGMKADALSLSNRSVSGISDDQKSANKEKEEFNITSSLSKTSVEKGTERLASPWASEITPEDTYQKDKQESPKSWGSITSRQKLSTGSVFASELTADEKLEKDKESSVTSRRSVLSQQKLSTGSLLPSEITHGDKSQKEKEGSQTSWSSFTSQQKLSKGSILASESTPEDNKSQTEKQASLTPRSSITSQKKLMTGFVYASELTPELSDKEKQGSLTTQRSIISQQKQSAGSVLLSELTLDDKSQIEKEAILTSRSSYTPQQPSSGSILATELTPEDKSQTEKEARLKSWSSISQQKLSPGLIASSELAPVEKSLKEKQASMTSWSTITTPKVSTGSVFAAELTPEEKSLKEKEASLTSRSGITSKQKVSSSSVFPSEITPDERSQKEKQVSLTSWSSITSPPKHSTASGFASELTPGDRFKKAEEVSQISRSSITSLQKLSTGSMFATELTPDENSLKEERSSISQLSSGLVFPSELKPDETFQKEMHASLTSQQKLGTDSVLVSELTPDYKPQQEKQSSLTSWSTITTPKVSTGSVFAAELTPEEKSLKEKEASLTSRNGIMSEKKFSADSAFASELTLEEKSLKEKETSLTSRNEIKSQQKLSTGSVLVSELTPEDTSQKEKQASVTSRSSISSQKKLSTGSVFASELTLEEKNQKEKEASLTSRSGISSQKKLSTGSVFASELTLEDESQKLKETSLASPSSITPRHMLSTGSGFVSGLTPEDKSEKEKEGSLTSQSGISSQKKLSTGSVFASELTLEEKKQKEKEASLTSRSGISSQKNLSTGSVFASELTLEDESQKLKETSLASPSSITPRHMLSTGSGFVSGLTAEDKSQKEKEGSLTSRSGISSQKKLSTGSVFASELTLEDESQKLKETSLASPSSITPRHMLSTGSGFVSGLTPEDKSQKEKEVNLTSWSSVTSQEKLSTGSVFASDLTLADKSHKEKQASRTSRSSITSKQKLSTGSVLATELTPDDSSQNEKQTSQQKLSTGSVFKSPEDVKWQTFDERSMESSNTIADTREVEPVRSSWAADATAEDKSQKERVSSTSWISVASGQKGEKSFFRSSEDDDQKIFVDEGSSKSLARKSLGKDSPDTTGKDQSKAGMKESSFITSTSESSKEKVSSISMSRLSEDETQKASEADKSQKGSKDVSFASLTNDSSGPKISASSISKSPEDELKMLNDRISALLGAKSETKGHENSGRMLQLDSSAKPQDKAQKLPEMFGVASFNPKSGTKSAEPIADYFSKDSLSSKSSLQSRVEHIYDTIPSTYIKKSDELSLTVVGVSMPKESERSIHKTLDNESVTSLDRKSGTKIIRHWSAAEPISDDRSIDTSSVRASASAKSRSKVVADLRNVGSMDKHERLLKLPKEPNVVSPIAVKSGPNAFELYSKLSTNLYEGKSEELKVLSTLSAAEKSASKTSDHLSSSLSAGEKTSTRSLQELKERNITSAISGVDASKIGTKSVSSLLHDDRQAVAATDPSTTSSLFSAHSGPRADASLERKEASDASSISEKSKNLATLQSVPVKELSISSVSTKSDQKEMSQVEVLAISQIQSPTSYVGDESSRKVEPDAASMTSAEATGNSLSKVVMEPSITSLSTRSTRSGKKFDVDSTSGDIGTTPNLSKKSLKSGAKPDEEISSISLTLHNKAKISDDYLTSAADNKSNVRFASPVSTKSMPKGEARTFSRSFMSETSGDSRIKSVKDQSGTSLPSGKSSAMDVEIVSGILSDEKVKRKSIIYSSEAEKSTKSQIGDEKGEKTVEVLKTQSMTSADELSYEVNQLSAKETSGETLGKKTSSSSRLSPSEKEHVSVTEKDLNIKSSTSSKFSFAPEREQARRTGTKSSILSKSTSRATSKSLHSEHDSVDGQQDEENKNQLRSDVSPYWGKMVFGVKTPQSNAVKDSSSIESISSTDTGERVPPDTHKTESAPVKSELMEREPISIVKSPETVPPAFSPTEENKSIQSSSTKSLLPSIESSASNKSAHSGAPDKSYEIGEFFSSGTIHSALSAQSKSFVSQKSSPSVKSSASAKSADSAKGRDRKPPSTIWESPNNAVKSTSPSSKISASSSKSSSSDVGTKMTYLNYLTIDKTPPIKELGHKVSPTASIKSELEEFSPTESFQSVKHAEQMESKKASDTDLYKKEPPSSIQRTRDLPPFATGTVSSPAWRKEPYLEKLEDLSFRSPLDKKDSSKIDGSSPSETKTSKTSVLGSDRDELSVKSSDSKKAVSVDDSWSSGKQSPDAILANLEVAGITVSDQDDAFLEDESSVDSSSIQVDTESYVDSSMLKVPLGFAQLGFDIPETVEEVDEEADESDAKESESLHETKTVDLEKLTTGTPVDRKFVSAVPTLRLRPSTQKPSSEDEKKSS